MLITNSTVSLNYTLEINLRGVFEGKNFESEILKPDKIL